MSSDHRLQEMVMAELRWEPSVEPAHIGVAVREGVVTLTGHVASYAEKTAAEAAVRRVKGVRAVAEEIEVRLPFDARRTDEDIAAAVANRLRWDVVVPASSVIAKVENGWVTLTGEVPWRYQKEAAGRVVQTLFGVVGVSNHVSIRQKVNAGNIADDVAHALHRSWYFDPQTVSVAAEAGKVVLTGSVQSPHERQVAAATAWAAPGVTEVENDLTIA